MVNFHEKGGRQIWSLLEESFLEKQQKHYTAFLDIHQNFKNENHTCELTSTGLGGYKLGFVGCKIKWFLHFRD